MPGRDPYYPGRNYAGYGLEPAQKPLISQPPRQVVKGCIDAAREAFNDRVFEPVPWVDPPYRGIDQCTFVRAVVNIPAAVDPVANAAGLVLAAAQSTIVPITVLTPTGASTGAVTLFTLTPPNSHVIKVRSWGITVVNNAPEAVRVLVQGGSAGGLASPPDPFMSSYLIGGQQPAHMILTADKTLTVQLSNLSPDALLIYFGICYWQFPVTHYTDDPRTTKLTPGFQEPC